MFLKAGAKVQLFFRIHKFLLHFFPNSCFFTIIPWSIEIKKLILHTGNILCNSKIAYKKVVNRFKIIKDVNIEDKTTAR
jgi:hypothetical protein